MSLLEIARSIQESAVGTAMRESLYWFPALILIHVIGLLIAAGTVVFWDLRLLGFGLKSTPVSRVGSALLPWTWAGWTVMAISGALLVAMRAGALYGNFFFRLKLILLAMAGLNVLLFHRTVYKDVAHWDQNTVTPLRARIAGGISLLMWFGILASGRAIGYTIDYSA